MANLSANTLTMAVQGVNAEICRIKDSVGGEITELEPDDQELLLAFSQAAMELKAVYIEMSSTTPGMPPYEQLVHVNPST
jgi:heptaprenylglyceryl phosphate synthase